MAIVKAINAKKSGRAKLIEMVEYVFNPSKNPEGDFSQAIDDFELDTFVNRFLHGQQKRKRHFKQFVVSLEEEWPQDRECEKIIRDKFCSVLSSVEKYFADMGYLSKGTIHMNTAHPHIHLLVETCNALTGKQFSQSPAELAAFKSYVSDRLIANGLEEVIRMREITEEKFLSEEEAEEYFGETDFNDDWDDDIFDDTTDWNIGTSEQSEESEKSEESPEIINHLPKEKVTLIRPVDKEECVKKQLYTLISDGALKDVKPDKKLLYHLVHKNNL